MGKKLRCDVNAKDWVKAVVSTRGDTVSVWVMFDGVCRNICLTLEDAGKLRKQIKKALKAIEGPCDDDLPDWFQWGVIVEITGNSNNHGFVVGEKVSVGERVGNAARCDRLDGHGYWYVRPHDCKPA